MHFALTLVVGALVIGPMVMLLGRLVCDVPASLDRGSGDGLEDQQAAPALLLGHG
ncbi:hypothetical protein K3N28_12360 [Glycomyces sp. TRM65418]|uniref:hypothetical protein n=1 Tax=Glycomyces sp. TRM65418 TaxID=2867006 RepID=UPI001CE57D85|nr:hypothetical protein [Glycomyces sp. TRM65418]MCC3763859.1 hypothetical protein [Glycomyces sp. TRM65418]QZD53562.1 hypothetical protein K3N28_12290 [Glycomyces sp. TRM65418]